jgi:hypothetical protein
MNVATRQPTHPYNIHEILIAFQKLDPGYKLNVREDTGQTFTTLLNKKTAKKRTRG